jgi:hypothetical protein
MTPIFLCWPKTSEADVGDMAPEVEPSRQYSVKFCCRATDDSRGAVWRNGVWHVSAYEAKVCNWIPPCGKNAPNDIHRRLLNVYGDLRVYVSTVRQWMVRFSSGNSDVKNKPRSGLPCTAVTPWNEERLDQLISGLRLGTVYRSEYWFQCAGNNGGNGILQSLCQVGPMIAHTGP